MTRHLRRKVLGSAAVLALSAAMGISTATPAAAAPVANVQELRAAVTDASADGGEDSTIELLPNTTYKVENGVVPECAVDPEIVDGDDNNETGDLDHFDDGDLTILTPAGQLPATIDMVCPNQRVLHHMGEGTLILSNVRIVGGDAPGGGVWATLGDVVVQNSQLVGNSAGDGTPGDEFSLHGGPGGSGGAIFMGGGTRTDEHGDDLGHLTIVDSTFQGNRAGSGGNGFTFPCGLAIGPGLPGNNGGPGGVGGAIFTDGDVDITRSSFLGNSAGNGGNGSDGCDGSDEVVEPPRDKPAAEAAPVVDEPVVDEPVVDEPVVDEPVAGEPVAEDPPADDPPADDPPADDPAADDPPAEAEPEPEPEAPVVEEAPAASVTEPAAVVIQQAGGGGIGGTGGTGGDGGAVHVGGNLTITASTFSANSAGSGGNGGDGGDGGDGLPPQVVDGPSIQQAAEGGVGGRGGDGGDGGAVFFNDAAGHDTAITNSTFDGNNSGDGGSGGDGGDGGAEGDGETSADGGLGGEAGNPGCAALAEPRGCDLTADGAGVSQVEGVDVLLVHVTLTDSLGGDPGQPGDSGNDVGPPDNSPDLGGGAVALFDWGADATVIGTNRPVGIQAVGVDCFRVAADHAYSVDTDGSCLFTEDVNGSLGARNFADFQLGALGANGGPTQTRVPGGGSALLNIIPAVDLAAGVDQRGVSRPQQVNGEIGAVEVLPPLTIAVTKTASAQSVPAKSVVTFTIKVTNTSENTPSPGVSLVDPNCANITSPTGDVDLDTIIDPGETWTYTCTATPAEPGQYTNTATATVIDVLGFQATQSAAVTITVTQAAAALARSGAESFRLAMFGFGLVLLGWLVLRNRPHLPFARTGWRDSQQGRHLR